MDFIVLLSCHRLSRCLTLPGDTTGLEVDIKAKKKCEDVLELWLCCSQGEQHYPGERHTQKIECKHQWWASIMASATW